MFVFGSPSGRFSGTHFVSVTPQNDRIDMVIAGWFYTADGSIKSAICNASFDRSGGAWKEDLKVVDSDNNTLFDLKEYVPTAVVPPTYTRTGPAAA